MPIPDIEGFRDFLSSVSIRKPHAVDGYEMVEAAPSQLLSNLVESEFSEPINIWYKKEKDGSLSLTSVIRSLTKELKEKRHIATPEMAKILLAASCLATDNDTSSVKQLNEIVQRIGQADSSQFWIAPYPVYPDFKAFQMGRFSIGKLDRRKLVHRSQKVNCDFFERYPNQFQDRFAIEGAPIPVRVFDWDTFSSTAKTYLNSAFSSLRDCYFNCLTGSMQDQFRQDFQARQEIFVAAGAPYIGLNSVSGWLGGHFISIYQNIGESKKGYFCPLGMSAAVSYAQVDQRMSAKIKELRDKYSFTEFEDDNIHQTLKSYCRFVSKAKMYKSEEKRDEAFLHFVIALDLLFGEKDSSTQKISERTAVVVSRALGESFLATTKRMKKIYEKRSKYVHEGISVLDQDISSIEPVIQEVLLCLLRLQVEPNNRVNGFFESWLKTLDYFIATVNAEKSLTDKELSEAGIALESVPSEAL